MTMSGYGPRDTAEDAEGSCRRYVPDAPLTSIHHTVRANGRN